MGIGFALYAAGAAALGALSIGQEFTWRTTATLLALPVRRATLGLWKVVILATFLTLLGIVTLVIRSRSPEIRGLAEVKTDLWLLPLLGGLCLAPWLTMLSRSAIAGTVFTFAIPALLWIAGLAAARLVFGTSPDEVQRTTAFMIAFFRYGLLALCAIGAVAGWRTFLRLEVADDQASGAGIPRWVTRLTSPLRSTRVTRRPRRRLVALAGKELRLHELAFTLAVLYAVGYVAIVALMNREQAVVALNVVTFLYGPVVALLAAASASAEERRLGVFEAQLLTPVSARVQWAVKVSTVVVVSALLAIGLPYALAAMLDVAHDRDTTLALSPFTILFCVTSSLYFSSISQNRLRALIATPMAAAALFVAVRVLVWPIWWIAQTIAAPFFTVLISPPLFQMISFWVGVTTIAATVILAVVLAGRNHRAMDHARGRVVRQLLLMAGVAVLGATVLGTVTRVYQEQWSRRWQTPSTQPRAPASPRGGSPASSPPGSPR
jgi:hypothetical protein